jgi:omega-6 fatty acid desaturase (delta-12 desaturase)
VSAIQDVRDEVSAIIRKHSRSEDIKGLMQVLTTFAPLALLWWAAALSVAVSIWLTVAVVLLMSLFTLRVFALMHECGHGSLFRNPWLNRAFGFLLGVTAGMPQYVWSQHHNYHHFHNGNWAKYRGPYTTLSVDEYAALTVTQQRMYRCKCSVLASPIAGFIYLIFNPRLNWIRASIALVVHLIRRKAAEPATSLKAHAASFGTRYCKSVREYGHMFWNNVVLLSWWVVMCWALGTSLFFTIYLISLSFAGAAGIVLFTVQHNFEHAYASNGEDWDRVTGAIRGTSFLMLPAWLNWFTANIGYHHVHHLSPRIPNYCLVPCHDEYRHLFVDVPRLQLSHVLGSLQCILWDSHAQQIISLAEYERAAARC